VAGREGEEISEIEITNQLFNLIDERKTYTNITILGVKPLAEMKPVLQSLYSSGLVSVTNRTKKLVLSGWKHNLNKLFEPYNLDPHPFFLPSFRKKSSSCSQFEVLASGYSLI